MQITQITYSTMEYIDLKEKTEDSAPTTAQDPRMITLSQPTTRHTGAARCERRRPFAVSQYSLLERGKDIVMIYPVSGIYQVKGITMHIRTDYPKLGNISITIFENNSDKNVTMEFMMFRTYVDVKFLYNFKQRKIIITKDKNEYLIDFKLPIYYKLAEGKHNKKDKKLLMRGPAILGSLSPVSVPNELSNIVVEEFIPLYDTSFTRPRNRVEKDKIYILFDGQ